MYEDDNVIMESEGNLVYSIFKVEDISEDIAFNIVETRHKIFPFPIIAIIDVRHTKWASGKALKIFSSERAKENILYSSTIVDSKIGKYLGNIYYSILNPPFPSKLHSNLEESINWIEQVSGEKIPKFKFLNKVNDTFDLYPN